MGFTPCAQILLMQPEETPIRCTINVLQLLTGCSEQCQMLCFDIETV